MQHWDPLRELEQLYTTTGRVMENIISSGALPDGIWSPPVDIEETDDAWVIEADLPGAEQDDVHVDVEDSELRITGEIKERERTGILRRRSRRVGQFELRVSLPGGIDPGKVEANLHGGVLTVRVPKPERSRGGRVQVTAD